MCHKGFISVSEKPNNTNVYRPIWLKTISNWDNICVFQSFNLVKCYILYVV